jgi:hypothetical protein
LLRTRLGRGIAIALRLRCGAFRPGLMIAATATLGVLAVIVGALLVLAVVSWAIRLAGRSRHGGQGEGGGQRGQGSSGEKLELHCGISWSAAEWGGA